MTMVTMVVVVMIVAVVSIVKVMDDGDGADRGKAISILIFSSKRVFCNGTRCYKYDITCFKKCYEQNISASAAVKAAWASRCLVQKNGTPCLCLVKEEGYMYPLCTLLAKLSCP